MMHNADEMYQCMVMAHNADLQIAIHTIGDASDRSNQKYPGGADNLCRQGNLYSLTLENSFNILK
jgi:hypothetical protein